MDIIPKKRSKIITLHEFGNITQRQIAAECRVSLGAVNNIIRKKNEMGSISPQKERTMWAKAKTSQKDDAYLIRSSKLNPEKNSFDLQKDLEATGVKIDASTLRRRLLECGKKARRPVRKQLLTSPMKKKRLSWARKYQNWENEDWRSSIF